MTILEIQTLLVEKIRLAATEQFEVTLDQIAAEVPPKIELGDLAFPVAFELAKRIKQATGEKRNPRQIAETLKNELERLPGLWKVEVAGAGYLNVFFDRGKFLIENASADPLPKLSLSAGPHSKDCVEHTSVNKNK